jgi:hypothetical protein
LNSPGAGVVPDRSGPQKGIEELKFERTIKAFRGLAVPYDELKSERKREKKRKRGSKSKKSKKTSARKGNMNKGGT